MPVADCRNGQPIAGWSHTYDKTTPYRDKLLSGGENSRVIDGFYSILERKGDITRISKVGDFILSLTTCLFNPTVISHIDFLFDSIITEKFEFSINKIHALITSCH